MLTVVFAYLTGVVVESPRFGDLDCYQLDNDVHGSNLVKIVGEVCAYTKRGQAIL